MILVVQGKVGAIANYIPTYQSQVNNKDLMPKKNPNRSKST